MSNVRIESRCAPVCVICTSWGETDTGTDSFFPLSVSHSLCHVSKVPWLFSFIITASAALQRHVLMSSGEDDQCTGSYDEVMRAILQSCTVCNLWNFCVVLASLVTIHVVNFLSLHPGIWRPDVCASQWVGGWTEGECRKWGQEGSKLLTGWSVCVSQEKLWAPTAWDIKDTHSPLVQEDLLPSVLSPLGLPVALEAPA